MAELERRKGSLSDGFTSVNRHFSHLNLPDKIACYSRVGNSSKCPTTGGLQNVHTELLSLLLMDSIFRDFFNVFLLLPIHAHQCTVRQSSEGCYFQCFPLHRGSGHRLSASGMLEWLYSNRLPFFLSSRLYQLSLFTHAFCTNNKFLDFDETVEYSKKQLVLFSDMRTVEGIQKLIRYAGSSVDGVMIQLWLDLQWLRHTDKDHGHDDMMKTIRDRYSSTENKLPQRFKKRLVAAVDETGNKSLNFCLLTRRGDFMSSYDILLHNPFINQTEKENTILSENESDPLFRLQADIMNVLKNDFCKRYLIYHNCLPNLLHLIEEERGYSSTEVDDEKYCFVDENFKNEIPRVQVDADPLNQISEADDCELKTLPEEKDQNDWETESGVGNSCEQEIELLASGRSKSTLPQISGTIRSPTFAKIRPKTCYPHLHPKITSHSRLSQKTSGYITMCSPDIERLATSLSNDLIESVNRSASEPNLHQVEHELKNNGRSVSMVCLTDKMNISVNEIAMEKIRKLAVSSRKDGTESQISNYSMSIDVSVDKNHPTTQMDGFSRTSSPEGRMQPLSPSKNDVCLRNESPIVSVGSENKTSAPTKPDIIDDSACISNESSGKSLSKSENLSAHVSDSSSFRSSGNLSPTQKESSIENGSKTAEKTSKDKLNAKISRNLQVLPALRKNSALKSANEEEAHHSSVVLDEDLSVLVRRKTQYEDMMQKRRDSSFVRPITSSLRKNTQLKESQLELRPLSDQIIKDKTYETMLAQDKGRFYLAFVASDQLAGGPFKNYLTLNNKELLVDYLNLWENIEIVRCLTNEGGRRGACAKSFGGNGFISCHDEWPIKKDDPYHQYHESLRKIKKYQDSWLDFHKRFRLIQEFFSENQIVKPYDTLMIQKHSDQLSAAGCNDEILALVQDHLVTKLKKEIENYCKFDSTNFYHYISSHDERFDMQEGKQWGKTGFFLQRSQRRNRQFMKPRSSNLVVETIFSPLSRRLWAAIDICEKMVFPFALRKLSLPLLTLSTMITMKMFIMRKRREKAKDKEKLEAQKALTGPPSKIDRSRKKKKSKKSEKATVKSEAKVRKVEVFFIDWEARISELNRVQSENSDSSQDNLEKKFTPLAPPSIDDLFLQDSSIKSFRRFVIRKFTGAKKDHVMNMANFLIAQKELENKIDCVDYSELSKGVCMNFLFCKTSILHEMNLEEKWLKFINKKKSGYPTFLLFMGAVVQEWIYNNVWSSYIATMYRSSDVDYEQFFRAKEIVTQRKNFFNKLLCKRLAQFVIKISNFLSFLSEPSQFEEFRDYLIEQRDLNSSGDEQPEKIYGKSLVINPNKLLQDLYLLIEIFAYKNLLLTSRQVAKDLSLDGTEEQRLFKKVNLIVNTFFDSIVPPRLQVNIPSSLAVDIMLSQKNLHTSYTLFNEVSSRLFQSLLFFWKKFCIMRHVPESNLKTEFLYGLSGKATRVRPSVRKKSNQVQISCSDFDRFKCSKGCEIGGFNYSVSHGYREIYRTKQLVSVPSSVQASRTLKSIHSSRSSISKTSKNLEKRSPKPASIEKSQKLFGKKDLLRDRVYSMITPRRRATGAPQRTSLPVMKSSESPL